MIISFCGIMAVLNNSFNTSIELPTIDSTKEIVDTVHLKPGFDFLQGGDIEKAEKQK